jgi:hypothetical protein
MSGEHLAACRSAQGERKAARAYTSSHNLSFISPQKKEDWLVGRHDPPCRACLYVYGMLAPA